MTDSDRRHGLPLPSEDTGDLTRTPESGDTEDFLVAREEGVPYVPPSERVLSEPRVEDGGPDAAASAEDDALALRQTEGAGDLAARCLAALRSSDLVAGDRLRVGASGSTVIVRGEVESIDLLNEVLGILGDVEGVDEVVDETTITNA